MSYTLTGPFTDGAAPGISAGFLNNVETWITTLDAVTPVTTNGTTAGTVKLYMPFQGASFKLVFLYFSGYENTTGVRQSISLPTAFTTGAIVINGVMHTVGTSGIYFFNGASVVPVNFFTGVGTWTANNGPIPHAATGEVKGTFNTVQFDGSYTSVVTGTTLIVGV